MQVPQTLPMATPTDIFNESHFAINGILDFTIRYSCANDWHGWGLVLHSALQCPRRGKRSAIAQRRRTMSKFLSFWKDESGAAAAEYALILAIVGAGIAAAAVLLGNDIANAITGAATAISALTF